MSPPPRSGRGAARSERTRTPPHLAGPDERCGTAAPAVLLAHECVKRGRADSCREWNRDVLEPVTLPAGIKAGVRVLGVRDQGETIVRFQCLAAVNGVRTDA